MAYPVAFHTLGGECDPRVIFDPAKNQHIFQFALHEWIGLAAYWASGRIALVFPGPGTGDTRRDKRAPADQAGDKRRPPRPSGSAGERAASAREPP